MPSAKTGEAGSTLRHGGVSLSTSAQKTTGVGEQTHFLKHQTLSMVWQQPRGREQVDAPSLGDDSPVLLKVEHLQSSATGCGVGHAQQALTEALDGGKVGSKPKQAFHRSACCPTTSFTTQRRKTHEQFTALLFLW